MLPPAGRRRCTVNTTRAALSLIELDATPMPDSPRGRFDLDAAARLVAEHYPRSSLRVDWGAG